jgi:RHS repeat-associated protein
MLKKVVRPDKQEVLFTYDAFGRRLSKQVGTTLHKYVWRGDVLIHQWQEDSGDRTLVSEDGSLRVPVKHHFITWLYDNESFTPVGKIADGKTYSIISDYLGTPFAMLDEQGARVWEDEMDIWGRAKVKKGSAEDCPFRYQGQYEDIETGLYYNRFRYYDPEIGIYISQDPIRLLGGNKIYSYVHDTNTHIDKLGLSCVSKAKLSIQEQLSRGKNARVTVNNKTEAETLLRDVTSGPGHKGGYMNTTEPGTFSPQSGASDWLPRPSGSKRGTYHWDEYNPNASAGDHAIEGSHLQIHTFEGKIIRIFY